MTQSWMNNDGLYLKYGTSKTSSHIAGAYKTYGPHNVVEFKLDLTTLGTSAAIIDDVTKLPAGARIEKIEVVTNTAATGTGALLNIGLQREDRSTELDYDGLVAALTKASIDTAGETNTVNSGASFVGALVGTTLAYNGYLTADYDTAAFTAGVVIVRIYFYVP